MMTGITALLALPPVSRARPVDVVILATGELNGRLCSPIPGRRRGGLAAVLELAQRERVRNPDTLLVDCGNALVGGYENRLFAGTEYRELLVRAGYVALLPGWRDWPAVMEAAEGGENLVPWVVANAAITGLPDAADRVSRYVLVPVSGIRVAFVGLAAGDAHLCHPPGSMDGVGFADAVEALAAVMPELRRVGPEIIVLLLDLGPNARGGELGLVSRIARTFPEIHAILANAPVRERRIGGLHYASAPLSAGRVTRLAIQYDTVRQTVTAVESSLLFAFRREAVEAPVGLAEDVFVRWLRERWRVVGRRDMVRADPDGRVDSARFLGDVFRRTHQADVTVLEKNDGAWFGGEEIRVADLLQFHPAPFRPVVLALLPDQLQAALREVFADERVDPVVTGIRYEWDGESAGSLHVQTMADGSFLHPRRRYRAIFPEEWITSLGGRYPLLRRLAADPLCRVEWATGDVYDALMAFLKEQEGGVDDEG